VAVKHVNQSYTQKIRDAGAALLRRPTDLAAYLRTMPCWKKQPLDYALPWYSFEAIEWIERNIKPAHRVFEYGGGGSSLFYARRTQAVTVAESHAGWASVIRNAAERNGYNNMNILLHELADSNAASYATHPFFNCIENDAPWDIISVDCFCGFGTGGLGGALRPHALSLAQQFLSPTGFIILDDSWLYSTELKSLGEWRIHDFASLGPCRYGLTSTAIITRKP
jgi:hypothetical protein